MQALVDVMLQHKADCKVAEEAAGALQNICLNGDFFMMIFFCRTYSNCCLNKDMHDAFSEKQAYY